MLSPATSLALLLVRGKGCLFLSIMICKHGGVKRFLAKKRVGIGVITMKSGGSYGTAETERRDSTSTRSLEGHAQARSRDIRVKKLAGRHIIDASVFCRLLIDRTIPHVDRLTCRDTEMLHSFEQHARMRLAARLVLCFKELRKRCLWMRVAHVERIRREIGLA